MAATAARVYSFRAFLVHLLLGLSVGGALVAVISPTLISWWASPPYGQTLNCSPAIDWAMNRLLLNMAYGALGFGLVVPLLAYLLFYRKRGLQAASAGTAPPP